MLTVEKPAVKELRQGQFVVFEKKLFIFISSKLHLKKKKSDYL